MGSPSTTQGAAATQGGTARGGTQELVGAPSPLPPGWRAVELSPGQYYYADTETQESQWEPPPPHVQKDWVRLIDPAGRAYWACSELGLSFYEQNSGAWQRLADHSSRTYWSNTESMLRFFEP
eukprot:NODE_3026_length_841_cov_181.984733.p1 GENE.NODE_3026_length_841_cov_181.984733~~NODE_3026_length_841_cov_181.984733.p1  ORF type:complete len:123 (+),score=18.85 NODE_3026_length_841_cov_181.984733:3-371(+)